MSAVEQCLDLQYSVIHAFPAQHTRVLQYTADGGSWYLCAHVY